VDDDIVPDYLFVEGLFEVVQTHLQIVENVGE